MTGTPLDLTPFGALLKGIGVGYWLIVVGALALVLWKIKGWVPKMLGCFVLLAVLVLPVALHAWERIEKEDKAQVKLEASMSLFKTRCQTAGAKVMRTVSNVDGVLLTSVRPIAKSSDRSDPNWPDAALPDEGQGDWYVRTFLFWEHNEDRKNIRGFLNNVPSDLPGYQFVDVKESDGSVYRYRLLKGDRAELSREPVAGSPARYAVSFVNIVDPEGRLHWIAGTKALVTDTATNEVVAEHVWYSIDPGQGGTAGFRSPWGFAVSCPALVGKRGSSTRFFVDQVLRPIKGE